MIVREKLSKALLLLSNMLKAIGDAQQSNHSSQSSTWVLLVSHYLISHRLGQFYCPNFSVICIPLFKFISEKLLNSPIYIDIKLYSITLAMLHCFPFGSLVAQVSILSTRSDVMNSIENSKFV